MASDLLQADPVSVMVRFQDEVQLACPLFQRRYVWKDNNLDQLWADIDTVLDGQYSKRFLGALVFNNESAPTASRMGRYWIIDGQQRLTTLYLTLAAIAEVSGSLRTDEAREFGRDIFGDYLVSGKSQSKNQPKLRPTLVDTKQFDSIMHEAATACGAPVDVNPTLVAGDATGTMTKAYARLKRHIKNRIENPAFVDANHGADPLPSLGILELIRDAVLECLELVEIRLGTEHDPNEVFDRLNKEGERLGIIDLVRNHVLKFLDSDPAAAQAIYSQEWKPFEEAFSDESAKAGYFFPLALTRNPNATKARTFATLADSWAPVVESTLDPTEKVQTMVKDLRRHQSSYNAIHSGRLERLDDPIREQVRRLVALDRPSVTYPYILQLLTAAAEGKVSDNAAADCLAIIESFLVRRALVGQEPTGLHAVFKKLWGAAEAKPEEVRIHLETATIVFPDDDFVAQQIRDSNLYARKICRYVIEEYERSFTTGDVLKTFPAITIDHVAPQALSGEWAEIFPEDDGSQLLLNTWGNLVPLSSEANSTKGTSSWASAKAKLEHETVFSTTKHLYAEHATWGPAEIQARGDRLAAWALGRWPDSHLVR